MGRSPLSYSRFPFFGENPGLVWPGAGGHPPSSSRHRRTLTEPPSSRSCPRGRIGNLERFRTDFKHDGLFAKTGMSASPSFNMHRIEMLGLLCCHTRAIRITPASLRRARTSIFQCIRLYRQRHMEGDELFPLNLVGSQTTGRVVPVGTLLLKRLRSGTTATSDEVASGE